MHAHLCENCHAIQPQDPTGWLLIQKIGMVEAGVHPLVQMGVMAPPPGLEVGLVPAAIESYDLCSDACAVAFIGAGYKSDFPELIEGDVPEVQP